MSGLRTRVSDGSVLKLIRMWLRAPVIDKDEAGPGSNRPQSGTPQGGVISPLLANSFLHWFDLAFHGQNGPARWANAKLVRYADDFVVLARYVDSRIVTWIERIIETRLGLEINRDKTRIVKLREPGAKLDFLGYTFQFYRDLSGRGHRYLHLGPSKKALARARETIRSHTGSDRTSVPVHDLVHRLNRFLVGWANYFGLGYPRMSFRRINWFVRQRLYRNLRRRSQRPFRPPKGVSWVAYMDRMGLVYL